MECGNRSQKGTPAGPRNARAVGAQAMVRKSHNVASKAGTAGGRIMQLHGRLAFLTRGLLARPPRNMLVTGAEAGEGVPWSAIDRIDGQQRTLFRAVSIVLRTPLPSLWPLLRLRQTLNWCLCVLKISTAPSGYICTLFILKINISTKKL